MLQGLLLPRGRFVASVPLPTRPGQELAAVLERGRKVLWYRTCIVATG